MTPAFPCGLNLWPAATCLVTELAAELKALSSDELRETLVVLPTKRLPVWLLAMLAKERQAFIPPQTATLDEFIARYDPEPETAVTAITDLEQELLLASLLKTGSYRHLRLGHEHEARQLLNELIAWDVDDGAFVRLEKVLAEDIFRSDQAVGSLRDRILELRDLSERFQATLQAMGTTTTKRQARAGSRRLAMLLADPLPLAGRRPVNRIYLAGFTSVERMHGGLLRALVQRQDSAIWVTEPPTMHSEVSPVRLLLELIEQEGRQRQPSTLDARRQPIAVHKTTGVLTEVAHALSLVQQAIDDGVPPSGIALLVTDDKSYGKALRVLLTGVRFEANVALALPLATTVLGTWLQALLELLQGDEETARILAFVTHPVTLERASGITRAQLSGELLASGVPSSFKALGASRSVSKPLKEFLLDTEVWLGELLCGSADDPRPLAQWTTLLQTLLMDALALSTQNHPTKDDVGLRASTTETLAAFFSAIEPRAGRPTMTVTKAEFLTLIGARLLAQEVRGVGDPLAGVQVLSVEEARYVPFDLAIVLGAAEGQFPRAVPQDYLLDNYLKTRIGLPGWQLLEAIEDTTFLLLRARLPALALLYPQTRGDEPCVRSRFIEAALALGDATEHTVHAEPTLLALLRTAANVPTVPAWQSRVERRLAPQGDAQALFPGGAASLASPMSASALESLIQCPYRFLLSRLGVDTLDFAEEDDARTEGDWLHDVLEAFFTGTTGQRPVAEPLATNVAWDQFREYALARLDALTLVLAPAYALDSETHLHLRLKAWPAFVTHLMTIYDAKSLPLAATGLREARIEKDGGPVTLRVGSLDIALRGSVDAVDMVGEGHLITDYKRRRTPDKREVKEGVAPQLPLYALAMNARDDQGLNLRRAVIGYWSILGGRFETIAAGVDAPKAWLESGLASKPGSLEEATAATLDLWQWRQSALTSATQLMSPDPSRCGMCRLAGVCRRDDPEMRERIADNDLLAKKLAAARAHHKGGGDA